MSDGRFAEKLAAVSHTAQRVNQFFRHIAIGQLAEQRILLLRPRELAGGTEPGDFAGFLPPN